MYRNLKRGEDTEQISVIEWAHWNTPRHPELKLLHHIPNGGRRNAVEAARFKAMGVKAGVPDLFLPVPRDGYAGLYIEMKYGKNKTTDKQNEWIAALRQQGYQVTVCYSAPQATAVLECYLRQPRTTQLNSIYRRTEEGREQKSEQTEETKKQGNLVDGYCGSGYSGRYSNI